MTTRIDRRFAALRAEGRAALVTFVMAGDPDPATSLAIVKALPNAGADVIEIGMPFSDPMADGPAIQAAGLRALRGGQTLAQDAGAGARVPRNRRRHADRADGILQPDLRLWRRRFLRDAKAAGVDGLIVVDLPPEEDEELCLPALEAGLNFIRLATPTTDDKRLPAVLANTSGFVYYVSITGVTGARRPTPPRSAQRLRGSSVIPICRSRSASASRTRRARPRSPASPTAWWSVRRWSRRFALRWSTARRARGRSRPWPSLARTIAAGVRSAVKRARAAGARR